MHTAADAAKVESAVKDAAVYKCCKMPLHTSVASGVFAVDPEGRILAMMMLRLKVLAALEHVGDVKGCILSLCFAT